MATRVAVDGAPSLEWRLRARDRRMIVLMYFRRLLLCLIQEIVCYYDADRWWLVKMNDR